MAWAAIDRSADPSMPVLAIGASRAEWPLCKQIPGCSIGADDIWRVPLTWPGFMAFNEIWSQQPITWSPDLKEWSRAAWDRAVSIVGLPPSDLQGQPAVIGARDFTDAPEPLRSRLIEMDIEGSELTGPQRAACNLLLTYKHWIYGDERGNGKTPPLVQSLRILHQTGQAAPALVVCPD